MDAREIVTEQIAEESRSRHESFLVHARWASKTAKRIVDILREEHATYDEWKRSIIPNVEETLKF